MQTYLTTFAAQSVENAMLLSPVKPILTLATFLPWAWLVSSKLDKDAAYFHLNRPAWNGWFMAGAVAAAASMLLIPIYWIGWPVGILLLLAPILAYWKVRNAAVPENRRFYITSDTIGQWLESRRKSAATRGALITFVDSAGKRRDVPLKEEPLFPTHLLAEDLLGPAIDSRASRIELSPGQSGFVVTQTIDGVKYRRDPVAADAGNALIDYFKSLAGLDVQNRRRRQVGKLKMEGPPGLHEIHVTTAGSSAGQEMRIEIDRSKRMDIPFDALGFLKPQMESLARFVEPVERHGIILIGAPPGNGLTTLGYSLIGRHDAYTTNIKTLEREIMLRRDGVDHTQFDADNPDLDFATNLQSILRRDPDVVLISDIMDKDTARVAAEPGNDGPLIYVPQRLPGVKEQVVDWVKRVGDLNKAVRALLAVINGRLVRTLCPNCKQGFRPAPDQLKKLGLPATVAQLFKAGGKVQVKNKIENCPVCQGTGYFGQVGVYEVMVLDQQARKMIAGNDLQGAYTHCRRNKMIFLQEAALQKVVEGVTSLEELARVITPPKQGPPPASPQPQPVAAKS